MTGNKIYPDASPPHECSQTVDGGLEQGGDRREPQIACGFDFLNTEATVYVNVSGVNDTLSVKLRGPKHSGIPDADMCNNIHYVNLGSENKQAFGKQAGHTAEYCEFGGSSIKIPDGTWVGVKAIEWNEGSGVRFQTWIENPEGSGWKLAASAVDNGGAGSCQSAAREAFTTSPCQDTGHPVSVGFRVDGLSGGGSVEFKGMSVREIAIPSAPLTTAPPSSGTTTPPSEEEDEDEDEDEEDDNDNGNGNGNGGTTGPTCSCPQKPNCNAFCNTPSTFQTCCFGGNAGLARVLRAKIGYSANEYRYGYRKNLARLSTAQRDFDFNSYRSIRLGNFV